MWVSRSLYYVECPHETHDIVRHNLHIIRGHNGDVGIAVIRGFGLQTWCSARSSTGNDEWIPHSNVNLASILALDTSSALCKIYAVRLLCAVENKYMVIVEAVDGVFQLDISNMQWNKLHLSNIHEIGRAHV